jgi:hypothetical protein
MSLFVATAIPELAVVEFTHDLTGHYGSTHRRGAVGVVVSARPERDEYIVEVSDAKGRTVDLVAARGDDLRVTRII